MEAHFGRHPAAEIVLSQPGLGQIFGARVLAEFGDDPDRYASPKARKNYAATSPITRASGKKKVALASYVHNDRLIDALMGQAFSAITTSPGARAYYDKQRARGIDHNPALRQLANRLVGILHGCLKTGTLYNETTAWQHQPPNNTLLDTLNPWDVSVAQPPWAPARIATVPSRFPAPNPLDNTRDPRSLPRRLVDAPPSPA